jgi:hypothetical protein
VCGQKLFQITVIRLQHFVEGWVRLIYNWFWL